MEGERTALNNGVSGNFQERKEKGSRGEKWGEKYRAELLAKPKRTWEEFTSGGNVGDKFIGNNR